jgi:hypothetical protein
MSGEKGYQSVFSNKNFPSSYHRNNKSNSTSPGQSSNNSESSTNSSKSDDNSSSNNRQSKSNSSKSQSRSPPPEEEEDPFFKDFYNRRKQKNSFSRPRLSERIFKDRPSIFDNNSFVDDFRKEIEKGKKMFFDGADPFGGHFPSSARGASPGPAAGGAGSGSGSPRMGRVSCLVP